MAMVSGTMNLKLNPALISQDEHAQDRGSRGDAHLVSVAFSTESLVLSPCFLLKVGSNSHSLP